MNFRLAIYEILTLLIMTLGWLREKLNLRRVILKDRTFLIPREDLIYFGYLSVCCDCGLTHHIFLRDEGEFARPERPKGYNYRLRIFRKPSPLYKGEDKFGQRQRKV